MERTSASVVASASHVVQNSVEGMNFFVFHLVVVEHHFVTKFSSCVYLHVEQCGETSTAMASVMFYAVRAFYSGSPLSSMNKEINAFLYHMVGIVLLVDQTQLGNIQGTHV